MSCRRGEDLARHRQEDDEEPFEAASSSSEESGDEEDRFPDQQETVRRSPAPPPQPLRRMNSDSVYDMSGMTAQLPAKKGLSMYYQGKSQSFACMTEVRSLEDLQKKEKKTAPRGGQRNKMKPCKSYAALGAMASSKMAAGSCANLSQLMDGNDFRAPRIPVNENCCYHQ